MLCLYQVYAHWRNNDVENVGTVDVLHCCKFYKVVVDAIVPLQASRYTIESVNECHEFAVTAWIRTVMQYREEALETYKPLLPFIRKDTHASPSQETQFQHT